jgi:hypothetical protein
VEKGGSESVRGKEETAMPGINTSALPFPVPSDPSPVAGAEVPCFAGNYSAVRVEEVE